MRRPGRFLFPIVLVSAVSAVILPAPTASGSVIFSASGTSSAGTPVAFQATLAITSGTLTIDLVNTSTTNSVFAADVLSSFYFDVASGTSRPSLAYRSATGFVYQVRSGTTDVANYYTPQTFKPFSSSASNLMATKEGDGSWEFRRMNAVQFPGLGFGIGTVGNGNSPIGSGNGFTPSIVGNGNSMINFSIYRGGDIDPKGANMQEAYLVKNSATFTFTGLGTFTEKNIVPKALFGLGTRPDSTFVAVPEPDGFVIILSGCLAGLGWLLGRRRGPRGSPGENSRG